MAGDVVDLIMQDHREVERLFDELTEHPEKRAGLTPVLTTLLTAHSRAEEAEVYPVAKDEAGETEEIAHSQQEHAEADELLAQLAGADPESAAYEQVLAKLVEAVSHHVQEEEATVLPGMRDRLDEQRRADLGEAFLRSRGEHLGRQPRDITKAELQAQARNAGVRGASTMDKDELAEQVRKA
jgi:hemerythrin superfamily protein